MVEIEFLYNGNQILIQGTYTQKFKEVLEKLHSKLNLNKNSINYLYNGKIITEQNSTINEIIKKVDKQKNKMRISIIDSEDGENKSFIINSKEIICPKCKTKAKIAINDYQIRIYDCKNNHDINEILLKDFENEQKIDLIK